jgi:hypothetical protein
MMDLSGLFSPFQRLPKTGTTSTRVEVDGRMEAVAETRDAAPVGQLQHQVERVVMWLRPDGWQSRARRNAWSAMVADSQRRQSRMLVAHEIVPLDASASVVGEAVRAR